MEIADENMYQCSLLIFFTLSPLTFITLLNWFPIPYGKHQIKNPHSSRSSWWRRLLGLTIPSPLAWFLFESPTFWLTFLLFPHGRHASNPKSLLLFSPFLLHYFHRTFIYPLRLPKSSARFPLGIAVSGMSIQLLNVYLQVRWVSHYKESYENDGWFWWRFVGGYVVFIWGMWVNICADNVLIGLKKLRNNNNNNGYMVPRGGWFELVSCANYFGEIVEWGAWAFMSWSLPSFAFLLSTCANLVPRALTTHHWYLEKFGKDYPTNRKAVIPFLC